MCHSDPRRAKARGFCPHLNGTGLHGLILITPMLTLQGHVKMAAVESYATQVISWNICKEIRPTWNHSRPEFAAAIQSFFNFCVSVHRSEIVCWIIQLPLWSLCLLYSLNTHILNAVTVQYCKFMIWGVFFFLALTVEEWRLTSSLYCNK